MTVDILQNSIKVMNEMRQIESSKKTMKKNVTKIGGNVLSNGQQHESYLPPYLLLNKNALTQGGTTTNKFKEGWKQDAHNERAQRQDEIERRLVGQLGDRFKNAQLLEVSEGSYLIKNRIRMPIIGLRVNPILRTKSSISKRDYLLSSKIYAQTSQKAYVMDKNLIYDQIN